MHRWTGGSFTRVEQRQRAPLSSIAPNTACTGVRHLPQRPILLDPGNKIAPPDITAPTTNYSFPSGPRCVNQRGESRSGPSKRSRNHTPPPQPSSTKKSIQKSSPNKKSWEALLHGGDDVPPPLQHCRHQVRRRSPSRKRGFSNARRSALQTSLFESTRDRRKRLACHKASSAASPIANRRYDYDLSRGVKCRRAGVYPTLAEVKSDVLRDLGGVVLRPPGGTHHHATITNPPTTAHQHRNGTGRAPMPMLGARQVASPPRQTKIRDWWEEGGRPPSDLGWGNEVPFHGGNRFQRDRPSLQPSSPQWPPNFHSASESYWNHLRNAPDGPPLPYTTRHPVSPSIPHRPPFGPWWSPQSPYSQPAANANTNYNYPAGNILGDYLRQQQQQIGLERGAGSGYSGANRVLFPSSPCHNRQAHSHLTENDGDGRKGPEREHATSNEWVPHQEKPYPSPPSDHNLSRYYESQRPPPHQSQGQPFYNHSHQRQSSQPIDCRSRQAAIHSNGNLIAAAPLASFFPPDDFSPLTCGGGYDRRLPPSPTERNHQPPFVRAQQPPPQQRYQSNATDSQNYFSHAGGTMLSPRGGFAHLVSPNHLTDEYQRKPFDSR